jgi:hypothetical protein
MKQERAFIEPAHEKQKHPRAAIFHPAKILCDERAYACQILNISEGGAKLQLLEPVTLDGTFILQMDVLHGQLRAEAVWRQENQVGVRFLDEPRKAGKLIEDVLKNIENPNERRLYTRCSVLLSGSVRLGSRTINCIVLNISLGGAMIRLLNKAEFEAASTPMRFDPIVLRIDRFGEFPGEITWRNKEHQGIKFLADPRKVAQMIAHTLPRCRLDPKEPPAS